MKFGLFTHIPWPEGANPAQVIEEATEQVQFGEEVGFHSAWFAEHHFSRYGIGSSSLVLASSIAARTKTIRLGRQSGWALRYWYSPCTIRSSWPKIRRPWM